MLHSLNTAQTGLNSAKIQVENVMNNIANENTDGYKTRNVNVEEAAMIDARMAGRGSSVIDVSRVTDLYMYENLLEENARASAYDQLDTMLEEVEGIFAETDESGLSVDLESYFEALENLRLSPYNEIYKNDVINAGSILVEDIQNLYSQLEELELSAKSKLDDHVSEVNNILTQIGSINDEIREKGYASNDLLDKRDALEQELTNYTDVSIIHSTVEDYNLQIGGDSAVRFYNNVHTMTVGEDYTSQKDVYGKFDASGKYVSNLIDPGTWDNSDQIEEIQTVGLSGQAEGDVYFLGSLVGDGLGGAADYVVTGDDPSIVVNKILADKAAIIANWNANNPEQEISDIVVGSAPTILEITYANTEGNVPSLPANESNGIQFATSFENQGGVLDSITYNYNNTTSFTVRYGDSMTIDTDMDGTPDTPITVDATNIVQAMVHMINNTPGIKENVTAYNGQYSYDEDGNMLYKQPMTSDHYLVIESNEEGDKGRFVGDIIVGDNRTNNSRQVVSKDEGRSKEGADEVYLELYGSKIDVTQGEFAPIVNNLSTLDPDNKISEYKKMLDNFVDAFVDMSSSYIEVGEDDYVYGKDAVFADDNFDKRIDLDLFEGSTADTLVFNSNNVYKLKQEDLDYMTSVRWKDDIKFGDGQITSFSKYYQSIRVTIAQDSELSQQRQENQAAVQQSLQTSYDKLTKVDSDEQMVNLIKFQSAYEANAKMITVVDEMLETILGLKR